MQPQCPSTSCHRHPEEQFTGFCPYCLRERLIILEHNSLSFIQRSVPSLNPYRPSTFCDRHPEEQFTSFCPSCLYERLTSLNHESSFSIHKLPITSTTTSSPEVIFQSKLRRTKSCPTLKNEGLSCALEPPQRKSCGDVMAFSDLFSIFNQGDEHENPIKETKVETCINLATSSSIIQNRVQERIMEHEADVEAEKIFKAMEDHMHIDSQGKESFNCEFKECIWFSTTIFKKKFQKWRQKQRMKKRE